MTEPILVKQDGPVLTLAINRPEVDNKVNREALVLLRRHLDAADANRDVRVIVLTGEGTYFCAGGQIDGFPEGTVMAQREFANAFAEFHRAARRLSKPFVAAVNGDAVAGGFSLLAACDLAIAASTARFGLPELEAGLFPLLALATSVRLLPRKVVFDVIYNARKLSAAEALSFGLVTKVVPPDELVLATQQQAEELATRSPVAIAIGRSAYESMVGMGLDEALDHGGAMLVHLLATDDALEAYRARSEDREPSWLLR